MVKEKKKDKSHEMKPHEQLIAAEPFSLWNTVFNRRLIELDKERDELMQREMKDG